MNENDPITSYTTEDAIDNHHQWVRYIDQKVASIELEDTAQNRCSVFLLQLAVENYFGLIELVRRQRFSSALVLVRSMFDSLLRGHYFSEAATEQQAKNFLQGAKCKEKESMFRKLALEQTSLYEELKVFQNAKYNELSDFAHGGTGALAVRYIQSRLEPAEIDSLSKKILDYGALLGFFVASQAVWFLRGEIAEVNERQEGIFSRRLAELQALNENR